jgi:type I restriction enzyme, S subunit
MAAEWPEVTVGELAESVSDTHRFHQPKLIFLNTSDVLEGRILHHDYSPVENWPGQAKKSIRRGDILFSEIRPANGRYAYVDLDADDYVVSTKLMVVRARTGVLPRFLYHYLTSAEVTSWLQHLAESRSGTFPQITFQQVAELPLRLPPLDRQAHIVKFLDCVQDKSELNRRMNKTLEALARAIFKSWFVDFDPVRAKAEGRQPVGMDTATAELFPNSFEGSQSSRFPQGWSVRTLAEFGTLEKGVSYKGAGLARKGMPMVNLGCFLGDGKFATERLKQYIGEYRPRHLVSAGDILIANTDVTQNRVVLGSPAIVPSWPASTYLFTHHVYAFRPKSPELKIWNRYFYYALLRPEFREVAAGYATGTTVLALPKDAIYRYSVVIPSPKLLNLFNSTIEPIERRREIAAAESRSLTAIRDLMLPKLLSGEIRLKDAEKTVGAVL